MGEKHGQENLLWFLWKGTGHAGEAASGWALSFGRLWGIEPGSSYLASGPGISGQVDSGLGCEPDKGGGRDMSSGLKGD